MNAVEFVVQVSAHQAVEFTVKAGVKEGIEIIAFLPVSLILQLIFNLLIKRELTRT